MWKKVEKHFEGYPAQKKVMHLLLSRGFRVDQEGKIKSGDIRIPKSQIAREAQVDRKAVDSTTKRIKNNDFLKDIFYNLRSMPLLEEVAPKLDLGLTIITPTDAAKKGILGEVAATITKKDISIYQAIADDPNLTDNPKLTIITEKRIPGTAIDELREIEGVKKVTIS
ncbi:hypothetical protein [Methanonatronarchaeum sp. AMET6-2]|uniref:hypothetical protein n=1 Tax=Methanonatronarchaeum sp. AMET6-2 TaxID=2933293 RepID=UPI00120CC74F|nr:hypothetical protein [Methanonatronarchaeum sp. AMET6-2]RZN62938.1 MAG: amino acid-binding protein [Methanonatronarchaeia archaeon]UOY09870.1 hypothetical protein MU439_06325 [Methanonatronarchaeum sp. AMET6-2]